MDHLFTHSAFEEVIAGFEVIHSPMEGARVELWIATSSKLRVGR